MFNKRELEDIPQLTLATHDEFKSKYTKRNFIFENNKFLTTAAKNSKIIKNIRQNPEVQVIVSGKKIDCKVEIITNFSRVFEYLKKEMRKLEKFYGNKYQRSEGHIRVSASNQALLVLEQK